MADDQKPNKAKEFFQQHWEKVTLGVAGFMVLLYAVFTFVLAEEDTTARDTRSLIKQVEAQMDREHNNKWPQKDRPWMNDALDPWQKVGAAAVGSNWSVTYATIGRERKIAKTAVKEKETLIPPIKLASPGVALGRITLTWTRGKIDKDESEEAEITKFIIERRTKGGKWETLSSDLAGSAASFEDTKVEPKANYEYRVTPVTDNAKYRASKGTGRGKTTSTVSAKAMDVYEVKIINPFPPQVYIQVFKYVSGLEKPPYVKFVYKAGDVLGSNPRDKTFVHKISLPGGLSRDVEFNTGFKLTSVKRRNDLNLERETHILKRDPETGGIIGCTVGKEPYPWRPAEIKYTKDDGEEVTIYHPSRAEKMSAIKPKVPSGGCPIHKVGTPDDTPMTPEEKQKEDEAKKLLKEADAKWKKKATKAEARKIYARILKEFKETKYITDRRIKSMEKKLAEKP